MSQILVKNLLFTYEGASAPVFENVSFSIDTRWKLGFIGRNGKGKTTFLKLLMRQYPFQGSIEASVFFDYFPYFVSKEDEKSTAEELISKWKPETEDWQVMREMPDLSLDPELLYRPFVTLSFGERTKLMLAVLFSGENEFLLIDEPTNHLDSSAREIVKTYLSGKKGFILVSHDRDLLDACTDHVLVLNRETIEVQAGNFSSWWENKQRADSFAEAENEKHRKEIRRLKQAADRASRWADKNENTKIGFDPVKEHDRSISTRAYIGAKTKKMESRVKTYEERMDRSIEEKKGLLKDIEETADLKITPLRYYKERLIGCRDLSLRYKDAARPVFTHLSFELIQGDRIFISGANGCGKSSLIRAVLSKCANPPKGMKTENLDFELEGDLSVGGNLAVSYISQDTSGLRGTLRDYAERCGLDYSLFLTTLRQLDFDRAVFDGRMEEYSEGQKKKVLAAASLLTPAHLYIWDEPMNYIDVFTRMQIEKVILAYQPTMLLVEHDVRFREEIATKVIGL